MGVTSAVPKMADTYSTYEHAKKKNGNFLFPSVGCMLQSFPPFKC
jgi:hypothetical protein